MALTYTPDTPDFGKACPDFNLLSTENKNYSLQDLVNGKPLVVMFICNHCPYVKAIEDRLIQLGHDLKSKDIPIIAISSNDANAYVEDSFENLQKRAREKKYPFPYLYDADQAIAKKFSAVCTPDFFVYDNQNKLAYRGRLDDSWKDPNQVTLRELYLATLELAENKIISRPQIPSMGCSMKWKKDNVETHNVGIQYRLYYVDALFNAVHRFF